MQSPKCKHLRIRYYNASDINSEENIISLAKRYYDTGFTTAPEWKKIAKRAEDIISNCNKRIQDVQHRELKIIEKIFVEMTRPSPFELTDRLARTAERWKSISIKGGKQQTANKMFDYIFEEDDTLHPNTEVCSIEQEQSVATQELDALLVNQQTEPPKTDQTELDAIVVSTLPTYICTNLHKSLSPITSSVGYLSYKSIFNKADAEQRINEILLLKHTSSVTCTPDSIFISNNTGTKQRIKLVITNISRAVLCIQFKQIIEIGAFCKAKVVPDMCKRLCPGLSKRFEFVFKLNNIEEFQSALYFKVGHNPNNYDIPAEVLCVPITIDIKPIRFFTIPDIVTIPPTYAWRMKIDSKYSTGFLKIQVNNNNSYHLHIRKRNVDLLKEDSSLNMSELDTLSYEEREEDQVIVDQAKCIISDVPSLTEIEHIAILIELMIEESINDALDIFLFKKTYLHLLPSSKNVIPIYFTKSEHIGLHQRYFDLEMYDPTTESIIMRKSLKVYSEILPHPIQIEPQFLDMSELPVTHGYHNGTFIITNNHSAFPVTIKVKLTTKMKKVFRVQPMETDVPCLSSVPFRVRYCAKPLLTEQKMRYLVHFTFKIFIVGDKSLYENVPPIHYELIAPCAEEYKKVYVKDLCTLSMCSVIGEE